MKSWNELIRTETEKPYFAEKLTPFIEQEYVSNTVYPAKENIFHALELTPLPEVKAVILGQDPYHEPGQAHGLAFSVPEGTAIPPSLRNIYEELHTEYGYAMPKTGNLEPWAKQGVLLLNTVLTVRAHEANSHAGHGWEIFTDAILKELDHQERPIVFMLWGGNAQKKGSLINSSAHLVLKTSHPSPLSVYRGFRGCGHFRMCNAFLSANGLSPIDWRIS